ncbi:MAG: sugar ABC transporter ATP-binding protein, partial [Clostridia bacterium]|nr:sugar ABC transporter ATP-binding protein [Clostridia bacterium]
MAEAIFRLNNISKTFPGVKALSGIDFDLRPGEVHCLCGENGAGKSTLIKIISGAYQPDAGGSISFEGKKMTLNPKLALELGIQTIYQEHNVFPMLSVTENIFAGLEILGKGMFVNKREMRRKTKEALEYLHCRFDPDTLVGELSSGEKKLVEIAKAIVFKRKIIILDEPTASFSVAEIEMLLDVVKKVAASGIAIAYISHHLDEVFKLADRITILRDGTKIMTVEACDIDEPTLVRNMVGRDVSAFYNRDYFEPGEVAIEAKGLTGNGVKNIDFTAYRGQVLGFAGMVGSGRSELMTLLMGGAKRESGTLKVLGKDVEFATPADAIRNRMCFITEDRQHTGLFLSHTIARNSIIANLVNRKSPFIHPNEDYQVGQKYITELRTKANDADVIAGNLSG